MIPLELNGKQIIMSFKSKVIANNLLNSIKESQSHISHNVFDYKNTVEGEQHITADNLESFYNWLICSIKGGDETKAAAASITSKHITAILQLGKLMIDLNDTNGLKRIGKTLSLLFNLSSSSLFDSLLSHHHIIDVITCLGYYPHKYVNHRQYLTTCRVKDPLNLNNINLEERSAYLHHLCYFKETVLPTLDDIASAAVDKNISNAAVDLVEVMTNSAVSSMKLLVHQINISTDNGNITDLLAFSESILSTVKVITNVESKYQFIKSILQQGLLRTIANISFSNSEVVSQKSAEIILCFLQCSSLAVCEYIVSDYNEILIVCVRQLLSENNCIGTRECWQTSLMMILRMEDTNIIRLPYEKQHNDSSPIEILLSSIKPNLNTTTLYLVSPVISTCIEHHGNQIISLLKHTSFTDAITSIMSEGVFVSSQRILSCLWMIKSIVLTLDSSLCTSLASLDSLGPYMCLLLKDNITFSCLLSLLDVIWTINCRVLVSSIVSNHKKYLIPHSDCHTVKYLLLRYERNVQEGRISR